MKFLKIIGVVMLVLLAVCVVGGLILPNRWKIETAVVINASPERIHREVATPRNFVQAAETHARSIGHEDPFEYEFSEQESGAGAWWVSTSAGSRVKITIVSADPQTGMTYDGEIEQDEVNDHGSITYEAVEGGTRVTWLDEGTTGIPVVGAWLGLAISGQLEDYFHGILTEMKKTCEAGTE